MIPMASPCGRGQANRSGGRSTTRRESSRLSFADEDPRGFGLLQRDRNFDHYLDGVYYDRRPSLWVEPSGHWGKGAIELVEIPTDDEIHDNVVAMWVPEKPADGGFARRRSPIGSTGRRTSPFRPISPAVVATRLGNGGQPGLPRPKGVRKFMVEFSGPPLVDLPFGVKPEAVLWASRGTFSYVFTEAVPDDLPGHWRAQFDLTAGPGSEPVEMRLFLRSGRTDSERNLAVSISSLLSRASSRRTLRVA